MERLTDEGLCRQREEGDGSRGKEDNEERLIIADGDDAVPIYERIIQDGIRPHAATIGRAHANGEVAVVFFDITPDDGKDHPPMTCSRARLPQRVHWDGLARRSQ